MGETGQLYDELQRSYEAFLRENDTEDRFLQVGAI